MMRFVRWSLALCLLLFVSASAFSQSRNTGEIRGTVSAGGAVLPDVTVTLSNKDTGETTNFVTNKDGIYDTVSTLPGNYTITFTKQGFEKLVQAS